MFQSAELRRFPYSVPLGVRKDEWYGEGDGGIDLCDSEEEEEEEEEGGGVVYEDDSDQMEASSLHDQGAVGAST